MTESIDAFVLERALFCEKNVWFYQVPAGQVTNLAPRADAWDPEHPLLTGSVRVLQKGDACFVQLFEPVSDDAETSASPTLFAQCPLHITRELSLDVYVHDCVDSSRYFMLRVEDETSGRCAFVGIGFPDRTVAFNFKATLLDYAKYVLRQFNVRHMETIEKTEVADGMSSQKKDMSLPKGTTIRMNLKTSANEDGEKLTRHRSCNNGGAVKNVPLIPPPPTESTKTAAPSLAVAEFVTTGTDEDWGDFTSA
ncbi:hypothetical protein CCR75_004685 [Bremia lactucae]|uniref:NECAP PHear domain-containing protein n=1 Tax=Bremia lactucae TaxID=4779 RepID=A0A976FFX8_BRELC|nr:hypothetical protein CCR75_004685 [Bremia lactucae]